MLGVHGGEVYDQWIDHQIVFNSEEVTEAMTVLSGWLRNEVYVNGGQETRLGYGNVVSIVEVAVDEAGAGLLTDECGMLPQTARYGQVWTDREPQPSIGVDGDVFAFRFPSVSAEVRNPLVATGDFVVAFRDRPEVQSVQTYLASPEFATARAGLGGWVSANAGVPDTAYPDPIDRLVAEHLTDRTATVRLNAAELMPDEVGRGAMWVQLTTWFAEDPPTSGVLQAIDDSWPAS